MSVSRKQQVINRLLAADGGWVNGTELASSLIGGSEGLKRLREARAEGWPIEERRHPDPARTVWQYRLTGPRRPPVVVAPSPPVPVVDPLRPGAPRAPVEWRCPVCMRPGEKIVRSALDPNFVTGTCPVDGHQRLVRAA